MFGSVGGGGVVGGFGFFFLGVGFVLGCCWCGGLGVYEGIRWYFGYV